MRPGADANAIGPADVVVEKLTVPAVCGRTTLDAAQAASAGFAKVYALSDIEPEPAKSMANAVPLLREVGRAIAADLPALTAR